MHEQPISVFLGLSQIPRRYMENVYWPNLGSISLHIMAIGEFTSIFGKNKYWLEEVCWIKNQNIYLFQCGMRSIMHFFTWQCLYRCHKRLNLQEKLEFIPMLKAGFLRVLRVHHKKVWDKYQKYLFNHRC